jgi:hypothetical protein
MNKRRHDGNSKLPDKLRKITDRDRMIVRRVVTEKYGILLTIISSDKEKTDTIEEQFASF